MSKLVKLATFDSLMDIKFSLLQDMLEQAKIPFLTNNENSRAVKPGLSMMPSNVAIEILVYEENLEEAVRIFNSIE